MAHKFVGGALNKRPAVNDPISWIMADVPERYPERPVLFPDFSGARLPEKEEASPSIDILEYGQEVLIRAVMPGIRKEDIDIMLTEDTITIVAERKAKTSVENGSPASSSSSFCYASMLPSKVRNRNARTQFLNGAFEIRLPKAEQYAEYSTRRMVV